MAAAEDLLMEVLTRKSNEIQWICGSGMQNLCFLKGFGLLASRRSAQMSKVAAWTLFITFLKFSKNLKFPDRKFFSEVSSFGVTESQTLPERNTIDRVFHIARTEIFENPEL